MWKALNQKLMEFSERTGQFYRGDLHRGESIESEASIVIIGDVRHGARVAAKGNIIVLGNCAALFTRASPGTGKLWWPPWKWCLFKSGLPIFPVIMVTKGKKLGKGPMIASVENCSICTKVIKIFLKYVKFQLILEIFKNIG